MAGNPVSYNPTMAPTRPLAPQRVYSGRDIIATDYAGSSGFSASDFALNPRLEDKFPSASLTASRYDMYQFEELEFRYHPTTAVTNTPGILILGWEPNANRGPPDTIAQVNAYEHHSEGPIYNPNITLRIPKNALGGPRYVRSGPTMSDLNLYDTGRLMVCSDDVTGSEGGYVEVSYRIRFFNYHLEDTLNPVQNRLADFTQTSNQTLTSGVAATLLFDTIAENFNGDPNVSLDTGLVTLPRGVYFVSAVVTTANSTATPTATSIAIYRNTTESLAFAEASTTPIAGNAASAVPSTAIFKSDGSDTLSIQVTCTSTSGVLNTWNTGCYLTVIAMS